MKLMHVNLKSMFLICCFSLFFVSCSSFNPPKMQDEPIICSDDAPVLQSGQKVKIMSWNVQYMAGKKYIFYYDQLDQEGNFLGKDIRPSSEEIALTLKGVAKIINQEQPDIIMLQEMDENARRTDYQNQLELLLPLISKSHLVDLSN